MSSIVIDEAANKLEIPISTLMDYLKDWPATASDECHINLFIAKDNMDIELQSEVRGLNRIINQMC